MDRGDYLPAGRRKGMVGGWHMAIYRSCGSLLVESGSAAAERRQTTTPIKAEENRSKGVEEREVGNDTESRGIGCILRSI